VSGDVTWQSYIVTIIQFHTLFAIEALGSP
jgi:hypothetical protein